MKKTILALAMLLGLARGAQASPYYNNTFDGSSTTLYMAGRFAVYDPFELTLGPIFQVDGGKATASLLYGVSAASVTAATGYFSSNVTASSATVLGGGGLGVTYGITAATGTFSASVTASSYTATARLSADGTKDLFSAPFAGTSRLVIQGVKNSSQNSATFGIQESGGVSGIEVFDNSAGVRSVYVDLNGAKLANVDAAGNLNAAAFTTAGAVTAGAVTASAKVGAVAAPTFAVSAASATTSSAQVGLGGAFTTTQIQGRTPAAVGEIIFNVTLGMPCYSTGTAVEAYSRFTGTTTCQ